MKSLGFLSLSCLTATVVTFSCTAIVTTPVQAAMTVFDLADDWEDNNNPNGVWSYNRAPNTPLTNFIDDYGLFPSPQPAYAASTFPNIGHVPVWLKSTSSLNSPNFDAPIGRVYMHGNDFSSLPSQVNDIAGVTLTSPLTGTVTLSGGLWQINKSLGRTENWRISLNDSLLTNGILRPTDPFNSSNPLSFDSGSGGSNALTFDVAVGDVINLEIFRSIGEPANLVGVDLTIAVETEDVPEPGAILGTIATVGLGAFLRRKRQR